MMQITWAEIIAPVSELEEPIDIDRLVHKLEQAWQEARGQSVYAPVAYPVYALLAVKAMPHLLEYIRNLRQG